MVVESETDNSQPLELVELLLSAIVTSLSSVTTVTHFILMKISGDACLNKQTRQYRHLQKSEAAEELLVSCF